MTLAKLARYVFQKWRRKNISFSVTAKGIMNFDRSGNDILA
jgi:hypothetical protein